MKIKYYFVTDKVKDNEMNTLNYPTKAMLEDFYTKPLPSTLFKQHRDAIMGVNREEMPLYMKQYVEFIESKDINK